MYRTRIPKIRSLAGARDQPVSQLPKKGTREAKKFQKFEKLKFVILEQPGFLEERDAVHLPEDPKKTPKTTIFSAMSPPRHPNQLKMSKLATPSNTLSSPKETLYKSTSRSPDSSRFHDHLELDSCLLESTQTEGDQDHQIDLFQDAERPFSGEEVSPHSSEDHTVILQKLSPEEPIAAARRQRNSKTSYIHGIQRAEGRIEDGERLEQHNGALEIDCGRDYPDIDLGELHQLQGGIIGLDNELGPLRTIQEEDNYSSLPIENSDYLRTELSPVTEYQSQEDTHSHSASCVFENRGSSFNSFNSFKKGLFNDFADPKYAKYLKERHQSRSGGSPLLAISSDKIALDSSHRHQKMPSRHPRKAAAIKTTAFEPIYECNEERVSKESKEFKSSIRVDSVIRDELLESIEIGNEGNLPSTASRRQNLVGGLRSGDGVSKTERGFVRCVGDQDVARWDFEGLREAVKGGMRSFEGRHPVEFLEDLEVVDSRNGQNEVAGGNGGLKRFKNGSKNGENQDFRNSDFEDKTGSEAAPERPRKAKKASSSERYFVVKIEGKKFDFENFKKRVLSEQGAGVYDLGTPDMQRLGNLLNRIDGKKTSLESLNLQNRKISFYDSQSALSKQISGESPWISAREGVSHSHTSSVLKMSHRSHKRENGVSDRLEVDFRGSPSLLEVSRQSDGNENLDLKIERTFDEILNPEGEFREGLILEHSGQIAGGNVDKKVSGGGFEVGEKGFDQKTAKDDDFEGNEDSGFHQDFGIVEGDDGMQRSLDVQNELISGGISGPSGVRSTQPPQNLDIEIIRGTDRPDCCEPTSQLQRVQNNPNQLANAFPKSQKEQKSSKSKKSEIQDFEANPTKINTKKGNMETNQSELEPPEDILLDLNQKIGLKVNLEKSLFLEHLRASQVGIEDDEDDNAQSEHHHRHMEGSFNSRGTNSCSVQSIKHLQKIISRTHSRDRTSEHSRGSDLNQSQELSKSPQIGQKVKKPKNPTNRLQHDSNQSGYVFKAKKTISPLRMSLNRRVGLRNAQKMGPKKPPKMKKKTKNFKSSRSLNKQGGVFGRPSCDGRLQKSAEFFAPPKPIKKPSNPLGQSLTLHNKQNGRSGVQRGPPRFQEHPGTDKNRYSLEISKRSKMAKNSPEIAKNMVKSGLKESLCWHSIEENHQRPQFTRKRLGFLREVRSSLNIKSQLETRRREETRPGKSSNGPWSRKSWGVGFRGQKTDQKVKKEKIANFGSSRVLSELERVQGTSGGAMKSLEHSQHDFVSDSGQKSEKKRNPIRFFVEPSRANMLLLQQKEGLSHASGLHQKHQNHPKMYAKYQNDSKFPKREIRNPTKKRSKNRITSTQISDQGNKENTGAHQANKRPQKSTRSRDPKKSKNGQNELLAGYKSSSKAPKHTSNALIDQSGARSTSLNIKAYKKNLEAFNARREAEVLKHRQKQLTEYAKGNQRRFTGMGSASRSQWSITAPDGFYPGNGQNQSNSMHNRTIRSRNGKKKGYNTHNISANGGRDSSRKNENLEVSGYRNGPESSPHTLQQQLEASKRAIVRATTRYGSSPIPVSDRHALSQRAQIGKNEEIASGIEAAEAEEHHRMPSRGSKKGKRREKLSMSITEYAASQRTRRESESQELHQRKVVLDGVISERTRRTTERGKWDLEAKGSVRQVGSGRAICVDNVRSLEANGKGSNGSGGYRGLRRQASTSSLFGAQNDDLKGFEMNHSVDKAFKKIKDKVVSSVSTTGVISRQKIGNFSKKSKIGNSRVSVIAGQIQQISPPQRTIIRRDVSTSQFKGSQKSTKFEKSKNDQNRGFRLHELIHLTRNQSQTFSPPPNLSKFDSRHEKMGDSNKGQNSQKEDFKHSFRGSMEFLQAEKSVGMHNNRPGVNSPSNSGLELEKLVQSQREARQRSARRLKESEMLFPLPYASNKAAGGENHQESQNQPKANNLEDFGKIELKLNRSESMTLRSLSNRFSTKKASQNQSNLQKSQKTRKTGNESNLLSISSSRQLRALDSSQRNTSHTLDTLKTRKRVIKSSRALNRDLSHQSPNYASNQQQNIKEGVQGLASKSERVDNIQKWYAHDLNPFSKKMPKKSFSGVNDTQVLQNVDTNAGWARQNRHNGSKEAGKAKELARASLDSQEINSSLRAYLSSQEKHSRQRKPSDLLNDAILPRNLEKNENSEIGEMEANEENNRPKSHRRCCSLSTLQSEQPTKSIKKPKNPQNQEIEKKAKNEQLRHPRVRAAPRSQIISTTSTSQDRSIMETVSIKPQNQEKRLASPPVIWRSQTSNQSTQEPYSLQNPSIDYSASITTLHNPTNAQKNQINGKKAILVDSSFSTDLDNLRGQSSTQGSILSKLKEPRPQFNTKSFRKSGRQGLRSVLANSVNFPNFGQNLNFEKRVARRGEDMGEGGLRGSLDRQETTFYGLKGPESGKIGSGLNWNNSELERFSGALGGGFEQFKGHSGAEGGTKEISITINTQKIDTLNIDLNGLIGGGEGDGRSKRFSLVPGYSGGVGNSGRNLENGDKMLKSGFELQNQSHPILATGRSNSCQTLPLCDNDILNKSQRQEETPQNLRKGLKSRNKGNGLVTRNKPKNGVRGGSVRDMDLSQRALPDSVLENGQFRNSNFGQIQHNIGVPGVSKRLTNDQEALKYHPSNKNRVLNRSTLQKTQSARNLKFTSYHNRAQLKAPRQVERRPGSRLNAQKMVQVPQNDKIREDVYLAQKHISGPYERTHDQNLSLTDPVGAQATLQPSKVGLKGQKHYYSQIYQTSAKGALESHLNPLSSQSYYQGRRRTFQMAENQPGGKLGKRKNLLRRRLQNQSFQQNGRNIGGLGATGNQNKTNWVLNDAQKLGRELGQAEFNKNRFLNIFGNTKKDAKNFNLVIDKKVFGGAKGMVDTPRLDFGDKEVIRAQKEGRIKIEKNGFLG